MNYPTTGIYTHLTQDQFKHWFSGYAQAACLPQEFVDEAMKKLDKPFCIFSNNSFVSLMKPEHIYST